MEVTYDEEEKVYFVSYPDLPGCVMHGETMDEAIRLAEQVKTEWIAEALKQGWSLPDPSLPVSAMSGRITLRVPRSLHRRMAERADQEGVSLNQLLVSFISEKLAHDGRQGRR